MIEKWMHRKKNTTEQYHMKLCVEVYFENILYIISLYNIPQSNLFFFIFGEGTLGEVENNRHIIARGKVKMCR